MDTKAIVRDFVVNKLADAAGANGGGLRDSDSLLETGVLDSFGMMHLLSFLEERFQMRLDGQELMPENFDTIEAISQLVHAKAA